MSCLKSLKLLMTTFWVISFRLILYTSPVRGISSICIMSYSRYEDSWYVSPLCFIASWPDLSPEPPCLPVLELHSRRRGGGRQEDWLEQVGQVKLGPLGCWGEPTQPATGSHYLTTCIQHHTATTLAADREASSLPDYWEKSVRERERPK